ncbi:MAG TPA: hypothetical protein VJQ82_05610 [Terriglobales bacterium]|nr:hypothetical protein [Terriglobales bacterium]
MPGDTKVWGRLASGEILRLEPTNIESTRFPEAAFDLFCGEFTCGTESLLDFDDGQYVLEVAIPHVRVADTASSEKKSYLGTIESTRAADDGIRWHSHLGEALLADFYHFERSSTQQGELIRIKETAIQLESAITRPIEPPKLIKEIEQEIDDPLKVLSFIGRKILRWFEIRASFRPTEKDKYHPCTFIKRRHFLSGDTEAPEPLLTHRELVHGKFQQLVENLRASSMGDWLRKAMAYYSSSYGSGSLEKRLAMTYLALEALTTGFAQDQGVEQILAEAEAKTFSEQMRGSVRSFCKARGLEEEIERQLLANINILGRASFKRKLKALVERTKIPTADLWPAGTKLSQGLHWMVDRRNKFIHEARIPWPPQPLAKDMHRAQAIVERAVLALLGWESSQPGHFGYNWIRDPD